MKASQIKEGFISGGYNEKIIDIYEDATLLDIQNKRYAAAIDEYIALYGDNDIEIYSAPGRTEVGGNHTDHQKGQVLAASVNMDVIAIVSSRNDGIIKIKSDNFDIKAIDTANVVKIDSEEGTSEALVKGVVAKYIADGYKVGGFDAYMTSNVLIGAGLSSSAAFEVAIGTVLSGLYNDMKISPIYIAQASQYAENVYFGKPCGLMDQMASSVGCLVNIDFEDTDNPIVNKVDVDFEKYGHSLCIVDTKASHDNLTDEYAAIPIELKKISEYFGKSVLREIDENEFYAKVKEIREVAGDRAVLRAIHFYNDHRRVGNQVSALKSGDFDKFLSLVNESGRSSFMYLQNVYSVKELSVQCVSVALALSDHILNGKGAFRVHGGGFAGTIQAFVPNDMVSEYKAEIEKCFGEGSCHVLKIRKYGGMRVL